MHLGGREREEGKEGGEGETERQRQRAREGGRREGERIERRPVPRVGTS